MKFGPSQKAGAINGLIWGGIFVIISALLGKYDIGFMGSFGPIFIILYIFVAVPVGMFLGLLFRDLYNSIPGSTPIKKSFVFGLIFSLFPIFRFFGLFSGLFFGRPITGFESVLKDWPILILQIIGVILYWISFGYFYQYFSRKQKMALK